jgi:hypothetical protein
LQPKINMLKSVFIYLLVFVIGLLVGLLILNKTKTKYQTEQVAIIQNGIKNVSKLVVVEEMFTEFYNYTDANKYFFETVNFEKKVVLMVQARVLVSYDLKKMKTEIDSVQKKIIIKSIPEEELTIVPTFKYYDFQQSMFNSFTKEELNMMQKSSIEKLQKNLKVTHSKELAKKRLIEELNQLWSVAKIMGWTIEDQTEDKLFNTILNPIHKDPELNIK